MVYHRSVFLSFSSLFSVFCFWPTSGKLPRVKIRFPHYFGITRRYMQKNMRRKKIWKKADFHSFFLLFTAIVRSRLPGPPLVPGVFWIAFHFGSLLLFWPGFNIFTISNLPNNFIPNFYSNWQQYKMLRYLCIFLSQGKTCGLAIFIMTPTTTRTPRIFSFSLFFAFGTLRGNSHVRNNLSPNILA